MLLYIYLAVACSAMFNLQAMDQFDDYSSRHHEEHEKFFQVSNTKQLDPQLVTALDSSGNGGNDPDPQPTQGWRSLYEKLHPQQLLGFIGIGAILAFGIRSAYVWLSDYFAEDQLIITPTDACLLHECVRAMHDDIEAVKQDKQPHRVQAINFEGMTLRFQAECMLIQQTFVALAERQDSKQFIGQIQQLHDELQSSLHTMLNQAQIVKPEPCQ